MSNKMNTLKRPNESSTPRPAKNPYLSPMCFSPFPVKLESPMLSPIRPSKRTNVQNTSLDVDYSLRKGLSFNGNLSANTSGNTSSGKAEILEERMSLESVLKEFKLSHLLPLFSAKQVTLNQLLQMKEKDFMELGIYKLNEIHTLKKICCMFDVNSSF